MNQKTLISAGIYFGLGVVLNVLVRIIGPGLLRRPLDDMTLYISGGMLAAIVISLLLMGVGAVLFIIGLVSKPKD